MRRTPNSDRLLPLLVSSIAIVFTAPAAAVDGVLEINQTCAVGTGCFAGDSAGFPVLITEPGSYRLTSNLEVPNANTTAIDINASETTVDLNGFSIRGPVSCNPINCNTTGTGHGIDGSNQSNVTVSNGTVRGMGGLGVLLSGQGAHVERIQAMSNGSTGISTGSASTVTASTAILNGATGISASTASVVSRSTARANGIVLGSNGIFASNYSSIIGCTSRSNKGHGFRTGRGVSVSQSAASENDGDGFNTSEGVVISQSTSSRNDGAGFDMDVRSKYRQNQSFENGLADDCGGGLCSERRRFYRTIGDFNGAQALGACAPGFHMASLWEVHDVSSLTYDTILGSVGSDSGEGPPTDPAFGWIRTGGIDPPNCNAWTVTSGNGTVAAPAFNWSAGADKSSPWISFDFSSCSSPRNVWCVEDE